MLANQLITQHYPTVEPDDKVFLALQLVDDFDILHIPVVDHNKYLGIISKDDLLDADDNSPLKAVMDTMLQKSVKASEHFLSALKLASQNNLSMVPVVNNDLEWLGAILVETNDAYITQFNTFFENETGLLIVTIKINKVEVSDILSTFQRYEYSVRYFIGEEQYENELRSNYDHLMSYLKF
jgi:CBS domain-containing protein